MKLPCFDRSVVGFASAYATDEQPTEADLNVAETYWHGASRAVEADVRSLPYGRAAIPYESVELEGKSTPRL